MKRILILSMFETSSNRESGARTAAAIESVSGFTSEATCAVAGKEFLKTWRSENTYDNEGRQGGRARFTCVKQ